MSILCIYLGHYKSTYLMLTPLYFSYIFFSLFLKWHHIIHASVWHMVSKYLLNDSDGFTGKVMLEMGRIFTRGQEQTL